ncbi:MAG TPA: BTAD domain-containing putative transcriptional regulator, partial [Abditibacterium sp.]
MALSSLRRQFESNNASSNEFFITNRAAIGINPLAISTDVAQFEAAVRLASEQPETGESSWRRAVELYGGRLLEGCYEDWIVPEQRRLEELFFLSVHQLVARLESQGEYEHALQYAWRAARLDPMREAIQRDLMRLYAATGQPLKALRQYHELRESLREYAQHEPDAKTNALAGRIEAASALLRLPDKAEAVEVVSTPHQTRSDEALAPSFSSLATGEVEFHLPLQFTRFFGRREEIARLRSLLTKPDVRLITLIGSGGSGKTRLALETVAALRDEEHLWPGGVWFVSLADLKNADLLVSAISEALSLAPAPQNAPLEILIEKLARFPTLLLLDSFETVVKNGAPVLEQLLERVPHLGCLVTSRQRLHLAGEQLFPVLPLPVPAGEELLPLEALNFDSVRLFTDRAQGVKPDFALTRSNALTVARLCAALEGIPLAIELAAARAGVLTPGKMLELLERRFKFLVSRGRGRAMRHQSLEAAIEWSYDLLEPDLRRFFTQLSLFRGDFSSEAAAQVCGQPYALDELERLRESSLVLAEEREGEMRFRLLDSIREYALARLEAPERAVLERRHAEFFVTLAESALSDLTAPLSAEQENLRAALEWSLAQDAPLALRGTDAMVDFWARRGQTSEARHWIERALSQAETPIQRAKALQGAGRIALLQGDAAAQPLLDDALKLFRALNDWPRVAQSLVGLGIISLYGGHFEKAHAMGEESLLIWRREVPQTRTEKRGLGETLSLLGTLLSAQCEFKVALPL